MPEPYTFDLYRIFIGNLPLLFYAEIGLRTLVLYSFALIMLRLNGNRSSANLTPLDIVIIIALGSAVGDPMFYPEVPVLHGILVITFVLIFHKITLRSTEMDPRIENTIEGTPACLVEDGMLDLAGMRKASLTRDEVFEIARNRGHQSLGELKSIYFETNGLASIFSFPPKEVRPGLPVAPPWQLDPPQTFAKDDTAKKTSTFACTTCGLIRKTKAGQIFGDCPRCEAGKEWTPAR